MNKMKWNGKRHQMATVILTKESFIHCQVKYKWSHVKLQQLIKPHTVKTLTTASLSIAMRHQGKTIIIAMFKKS